MNNASRTGTVSRPGTSHSWLAVQLEWWRRIAGATMEIAVAGCEARRISDSFFCCEFPPKQQA